MASTVQTIASELAKALRPLHSAFSSPAEVADLRPRQKLDTFTIASRMER